MPNPPPSARTVSVQLPEEVVRGLANRIRGSSFANVDAFIAFVLARLLDEPERSGFSEQEERRLKERLRSLGYID